MNMSEQYPEEMSSDATTGGVACQQQPALYYLETIPRPERIAKAVLPLALLAIALIGIWAEQYRNAQLAEYWWYAWPVALVCVSYSAIQFRTRTRRVLTEAGKVEEQKRKEAERKEGERAAIPPPQRKLQATIGVRQFNWLDRAERSWPKWAIYAWAGAGALNYVVIEYFLGWLHRFIPSQPDLYSRYSEIPLFLHGIVQLSARWYAGFLDLPAYGRQIIGFGLYWIALGVGGLFLAGFATVGFFTLARKITNRPPLEDIERVIEAETECCEKRELNIRAEPNGQPLPVRTVPQSRHPVQTFLFRLAIFLTLPTWFLGVASVYGVATNRSGEAGLFLFLIGLWNAFVWGLYWVLCGLFPR